MTQPLPRGIVRYRDRYRVRVTVDGQRIVVGDYDTPGEARNALTLAQADILRGTFVSPAERRAAARAAREKARADSRKAEEESLTISQWAGIWLRQLADAGRSQSTLITRRSTLRAHILPTIGSRTLAKLRQDDVDELLRSRHSPAVRTNVASTLRAMLRAAASQGAGGLTAVPVRIPVPKPNTSAALDASRIATPEQVRALCEAMPPRLALAPMLAAMMALRLGEVLGLQRGDVEGLENAGGAVLHVVRQWSSKTTGGAAYTPPKAGSAGALAIPDVLVPMIAEHLERYVGGDAHAPLFTAAGAERPLSQTAFDRHWRKAREVAGMEGYRFHDLRHTGLTMYARTGATLVEIMARGRHRNPDVAVRYQHATMERDRTNAARLGQAWAG